MSDDFDDFGLDEIDENTLLQLDHLENQISSSFSKSPSPLSQAQPPSSSSVAQFNHGPFHKTAFGTRTISSGPTSTLLKTGSNGNRPVATNGTNLAVSLASTGSRHVVGLRGGTKNGPGKPFSKQRPNTLLGTNKIRPICLDSSSSCTPALISSSVSLADKGGVETHPPPQTVSSSSSTCASASAASDRVAVSTTTSTAVLSSDVPVRMMVGGPRPFQRTSSSGSNGLRQMTLFGETLAPLPPSSSNRVLAKGPGMLSLSSQSVPSGSRQFRTKKWDRTAYAKSGRLRIPKGKDKQQQRDEFGDGMDPDDQDDDDHQHGWENNSNWQAKSIPQPIMDQDDEPLPPLQDRKLDIDREAAKTWIYPTNLSKRDYQFNIVKEALFNNVFVALPTGTGKTFIAAVVILNLFRWFPQGKIVFMAPTRPLVDQQKEACHRICGLPWDVAVDLTGSKAKSLRQDEWQTKRIFYMTPQTFENDLNNGNCDPHQVICIVIDEAHRGTGNYAYGNVVSLLMRVNPHFRVLALSATPGNSSEKVQEVIDRLHINQIEIRTEEALDLRPYMHRKKENIIRVPLGRDLNVVKDHFAKLMKTHMDPLINHGMLHQRDPVLLHPYGVSSIKDRHADKLRERPQLWTHIGDLSHMAFSMQYLVEQSVKMFYNRIMERSSGINSNGKKGGTRKSQSMSNNNSSFRAIIQDLETMQDHKGRMVHPKMIQLKQIVQDHFDRHAIARMETEEAVENTGGLGVDGQPASSQRETRVMVFCQYRECVHEMVEYLNDAGILAAAFVGQAKGRAGDRGMSQKDQEKVIQQFKAGYFNTLVATSIGEEGLDIGEVDLTVCYEAVKDSVRMLQRIGRTGRKREGRIVVLMSEGREETNWRHSKESYKAVQADITSRDQYVFYDDVDRLVPTDIITEVEFKAVEQPEFDPSMISDGKKRRSKKTQKMKTDSSKKTKDPKRNMPDGALLHFMKASSLVKRKRGKGQDDSDDEIHRRARQLDSSDTESEKRKNGKAEKKKDKQPDEGEVEEEDDDEDDEDEFDRKIKTGLFRRPFVVALTDDEDDQERNEEKEKSNHIETCLTKQDSDSEFGFDDNDFAEIDSEAEREIGKITQAVTTTTTTLSGRGNVKKPKKTDEFELMDLEWPPSLPPDSPIMIESSQPGPDSSPLLQRRRAPHPIVAELAGLDGENQEVSARVTNDEPPWQQESPGRSMTIQPLGTRRSRGRGINCNKTGSDGNNGGTRRIITSSSPPPVTAFSEKDKDDDVMKARPVAATLDLSSPIKFKGTMGPPDSVPRRSVQTGFSSDVSPAIPLRTTTHSRRRPRPVIDEEEDEEEQGIPEPSTPTRPTKKNRKSTTKKKKKISNSPTSRALFQYEADRSTDEEMHGERDENDEGLRSDEEDEDDRAAVGDFEPTQAPKGYHQQSIYIQSLLSQNAPTPFRRKQTGRFPEIGGRFGYDDDDDDDADVGSGGRFGRLGGFTGERMTVAMAAPPSSQSRRGTGYSESDRYSQDSFVVSDGDEIVFDSQVDGLPDDEEE